MRLRELLTLRESEDDMDDEDKLPDHQIFQTKVRPQAERVMGDESVWLDVDGGDQYPGIDSYLACNGLEQLITKYLPFIEFADGFTVVDHPGNIDTVGEELAFRGSFHKLLKDGKESIFLSFFAQEYGGPGAPREYLVRKSDIEMFKELADVEEKWKVIEKRKRNERFMQDLMDGNED
jgi:hypothetical protein